MPAKAVVGAIKMMTSVALMLPTVRW
jgi:hypothetical protein